MNLQPLRGEDVDEMIREARDMAPILREMRLAKGAGGQDPADFANRLEAFARELANLKETHRL